MCVSAALRAVCLGLPCVVCVSHAEDIGDDEDFEKACRRSNNSADPRALGVMFKADNGARVRSRLETPAGVFLQFAPKGSFRLDHVIEFLEHDLGHADTADGSTAEICALDYFAPHLRPSVFDHHPAKGARRFHFWRRLDALVRCAGHARARST